MDDDLFRLIEGGVPDPPLAPLAVDRLGTFGAVLYAEFDGVREPMARVQLAHQSAGTWIYIGGGGRRAPQSLVVRLRRTGPDELFLIPFGSGSLSSDEIDPSGQPVTIYYLLLHATSEVARVVVREDAAARELLPAGHGNVVVLHENPGLPEVSGFDAAGRELVRGIEHQTGFQSWAERRRRGHAW